MKILIASPEAQPFVKTGGLADVVGALIKEYLKMDKTAYIVLPLYRKIRKGKSKLEDTGIIIKIPIGGEVFEGRIFTNGTSAYFIACDKFFDRPELYGTSEGDYQDNASRFVFFSRGILEACKALDLKPDIIHCNDWQTGLIPLYIKTLYRNDKFFKNTATLFTIHNLGYQGLFPLSQMTLTGLGSELFRPDGIEFYGKISFIKAGIIASDILNTVSRNYSKEILTQEFGFGLDGLLRKRVRDLYGVLNGIDMEEWNPSKDSFIPSNYSTDDCSGKISCKKELTNLLFGQENMYENSCPLIGIVGRLSTQKGFDLVIQSVDKLVSYGVQLAILGKGDKIFHTNLSKIAKKYQNKVSVSFRFEETLAHKIYAGADFFLMPSRYEPCGLGQLISMRYGCIPIARRTGGLADTIRDYEPLTSRGTGFLFSDYTPSAMQNAVKLALCVYTDSEKMHTMIIDCMKTDFSWMNSAKKYIELYKIAAKKKRFSRGR